MNGKKLKMVKASAWHIEKHMQKEDNIVHFSVGQVVVVGHDNGEVPAKYAKEMLEHGYAELIGDPKNPAASNKAGGAAPENK